MFLAPAFLLGLLAIGVPIWLHRVARANPTQHPFASLMFVEASETQRTAKRTLRYWLLLSLRILAAAHRAGHSGDERQCAIARDRARQVAVDAGWRSLAARTQ
jgi:hypothetical protein